MNALHTNLNENMSMVPQNNNPHLGSSFDDFLKEQNIFEDVHAAAKRRALDEQTIDEEHLNQSLSWHE
jgi:hypothetical protein